MSDFISRFWSNYVAVISLLSILGCVILLWLTARKRVAPSADNTTGHVWDGDLREANNPLPMWWVGLFVLTIVFGLGYLAVFPGLGSFRGQSDWTSRGEYEAEVAKATQELAPVYAKYTAMPVEEIARDPQAHAIGERLFMGNCAQCHGSDARGSKGFPDLTDKDWLYGGTPERITESITKGRVGVMPPMAAAVGTSDDVKNVANYVLSLSGEPHDSVRAGLGKSKFTVCVACHGVGGVGNQTLGAPNLSDKIWLHGYGEAAIIQMINSGKRNEMPAQERRLTEAQIRMVASYVWGLSNSTAAAKP
ncbi:MULTISPECIES: cytochrome-c oxidase, cbb3-type subunit III [Variovorax]|jgi:cytochrome c oxidase cbb3-type subunit III|uniref:cytochrome-c oxidase, cbb3-type subunit III n=1 Tax=Variovorax TaxID=34072 RepID=UPI00086BCB0D|nr:MULTISPECIES: cytochrome-c oxidase, cbb3-type subunit III [Variovorax]MBN8758169.1 cytochrome-c oxidase, cbb3-type subunit III [Variovorax sp.]ODU12839.1 MAG: cytochrome-c oxidase, cbb3-type subunit III [Variovorax sp. SCN 67-85]ODV19624.1 MAG: cytochrome-c oxidase, cbb3-type subunit III [Variovorax sp. SCN 67-20]OJZ06859.1 MAG: cytochrome-c oxidase, cbb3-type subunit III [Variovorax sp. 67-131]UKI07758.1 cytochrome-c oxidase, cbb3-type subunit III [Variovorax paradoxus]